MQTFCYSFEKRNKNTPTLFEDNCSAFCILSQVKSIQVMIKLEILRKISYFSSSILLFVSKTNHVYFTLNYEFYFINVVFFSSTCIR